MSVIDQDQGAPIMRGSPLARRLDGFAVPDLSADFAERVLAAAGERPAASAGPLPRLRRAPARARGWRIGQRIGIGLASFGLLATAAAATGLLEQLAIPVPSAGTMWASLTGTAAAAPADAPKIRDKSAGLAVAAPTPAPLAIDGTIDTPEELGEVFRRVDQVRSSRREERRAIIDQRIRNEIERRRAAGLRVPTPEEEARFRTRVEQELARREQRADQAMQTRREAMQQKVEKGETLTREDITGRAPVDPALRERVRELRQLSPEQRREAWAKLPPEERRAIRDAVRARRGAAAVPSAAPTPQASPAPAVPGE